MALAILTCDHASSPKSTDACDESCQEQKIPAAEVLAQLYAARLSTVKVEPDTIDENSAVAQADAFVVLGHLAILLGMLMRPHDTRRLQQFGDGDVQRIILDAIPGMSHRAKLDRMVQQAKEVGQFYEAITAASQATEGDASGDRVQEGESAVARNVVRVLEQLRDSSR
jgi:hypothetical protein